MRGEITTRGKRAGFVLTELLVAGLIATFLLLGLVQMASATSSGLRLIESLSESQQGGRFAIDQMRDAVMAAGFRPRPWEDANASGLSTDSSDGGFGGSDVLVVRQLSDRNCYGNPNSVLGADGRAAFYARQSIFERTSVGNLAHTCFYGPDDGTLVRQINRQGMVSGVESFQVLYAEDIDGDSKADRRVRAGRWNDIDKVLGVQVGLLLATVEPVGDSDASPLTVLDESFTQPSDGRLRRVWTTTFPLGLKLR
jgi:hypothetical protein